MSGGVRAPIANLSPGQRKLSREASHYLCRVLRLREGDAFVAFDPDARIEANAVVDVASGEGATVTLDAPHAAAVVATAPIVLVYGLAKGDKVDMVVRDATELGATRILVARTSRAVPKVDGERAGAKVERWRRIAEQAARQCGRADPPVVEGVLSWRDALEAAAGEAVARYCLWENATNPLGDKIVDDVRSGASLALAVGPEGGLTSGEVDEARGAGFQPVSIGRFVLRTETVPAVVLGAVRVLSRS